VIGAGAKRIRFARLVYDCVSSERSPSTVPNYNVVWATARFLSATRLPQEVQALPASVSLLPAGQEREARGKETITTHPRSFRA
jgi:hypothetical protein